MVKIDNIKNTFYDVELIPERAESQKIKELTAAVTKKRTEKERGETIRKLSAELDSYKPQSTVKRIGTSILGGLKQLKQYKLDKEKAVAAALTKNKTAKRKVIKNIVAVSAPSFYDRTKQGNLAEQRSKEFFKRFK
jgi:hypothetical protein